MFPLPHLLGCFQNSSILVAALHKSAGSHRNRPTALSPAHTASRSSPCPAPSLWGLAGPATSLPFPFLPSLNAQLVEGGQLRLWPRSRAGTLTPILWISQTQANQKPLAYPLTLIFHSGTHTSHFQHEVSRKQR